MGKGFVKFLNMIRLNDEEYDDYDDYDDFDDEYEDDFEDIPAPVVKKKTFKKDTADTKREAKSSAKKTQKHESTFQSSQTVAAASTSFRPRKDCSDEIQSFQRRGMCHEA